MRAQRRSTYTLSIENQPLTLTIEIHGRHVGGFDLEDTEPVSRVVPSKWRHPLCTCVGVGNVMGGTPLFGFLPQRLGFHLSHAYLRAWQGYSEGAMPRGRSVPSRGVAVQ